MSDLLRFLHANRLTAVVLVLSVAIVLASTDSSFFPQATNPAAAPEASWHRDGLAGVTVHFFALGHTHPGLVFAGTDQGVYRRDGLQPWKLVLAAQTVWSVTLAGDDRTVVAGDEAGYVAASTDAGRRWQQHLITPDGVYAVTTQPGTPRHMLAGAGGGIFLSRDGGRSWQRRLALGQSAIAAFAWLPGSSSVVFGGAVTSSAAGSTQVYISQDAGLTWQVFGRGLNTPGGIMSLAVTTAGGVFTGTMGSATWKATLERPVWGQVANGMPLSNDHVAGMAVVSGRPTALYVSTLSRGVYRTMDGGRHWSNISNGLPDESGDKIVLSLAYAKAWRRLYAGTTNGVYALAVP